MLFPNYNEWASEPCHGAENYHYTGKSGIYQSERKFLDFRLWKPYNGYKERICFRLGTVARLNWFNEIEHNIHTLCRNSLGGEKDESGTSEKGF